MAALGVSQMNFSREYESFIGDAKKIADVRQGTILTWGRKPEVCTFDRFKWIEENYFRSCFIHGQEEYSNAALRWATSLAQKIHTFPERNEKDIELFNKVMDVFNHLSFVYKTRFMDRCQNNYERSIIRKAFENYSKAAQIMPLIINVINFDKKTYKDFIIDAQKFAKINTTDILTWDENLQGCSLETIETYRLRFMHSKKKSSRIILMWTKSLAQRSHSFHEMTKEELDLLIKVRDVFSFLAFYYGVKFIDRCQNKNERSIYQEPFRNYSNAAQIMQQIITSKQTEDSSSFRTSTRVTEPLLQGKEEEEEEEEVVVREPSEKRKSDSRNGEMFLMPQPHASKPDIPVRSEEPVPNGLMTNGYKEETNDKDSDEDTSGEEIFDMEL